MKIFSNMMEKLPKALILGTITVLMGLSCFTLYTLKVGDESLSSVQESVEESSLEEKRNIMRITLRLGYNICEQSTEILASKLESEILRNYDLDRLKYEFENSVLSDELYTLMEDTLSTETVTNKLFVKEQKTMVANMEGIMAEFSNTDKNNLSYHSKILPWEEYVNSTEDTKLTSKALKTVLEDGEGVAFIQRKGENNMEVVEFEDVVSMYLKDGIDALQPYYFLTASYITEDADIFGVSDKTFLKSNKNYKLVVLNTVSVEEVMDIFEKEIVRIDKRTAVTNEQLLAYSNIMKMSSMFGVIFIFVISIMMACIYNNRISEEDEEETTPND